MTIIIPTTQPARWLVPSQTLDGQTLIGEATIVSESIADLVWAEGDDAFLEAGQGVAYKPLPSAGTWLEAGEIYSYGGGLVIVRQSHTRTEHNPADVLALFLVYRADASTDWIAGEQVEVGTIRSYQGQDYQCLQKHVTQSDWTPPAVPALWKLHIVTPPTAEWQPGVAYKIGDEVTYNGVLYRCRQAHTSIVSWEPPNVLALWLPI